MTQKKKRENYKAEKFGELILSSQNGKQRVIIKDPKNPRASIESNEFYHLGDMT